MAPVQLYNSLTRKKEVFSPVRMGEVSFYSCGPTVYDYAHLGNLRTYIFNDVLKRVLAYAGYKVIHIMNVTDVGHLMGDILGDADVGEDRLELAKRRERKTAWEIAEFYTKAFLADCETLNILPPTTLVKATEHIKEMIALIKRLEKKGYTYTIKDGVYFDTSKFQGFGKLSGQKSGRRAGARIEPVPGKKNPSDFALWKFSREAERRDMEWASPWGKGFPGWHIECSAMSMKYLGETFDIHTGGEDHIPIHHENEIAQSEAATGRPFVRYWLHSYFMTVDGRRMGKSEGNAFTLDDLVGRGFAPASFRYLCLQTHYRSKMDFTWEALEAAQRTLRGIRELGAREKKTMDKKTWGAVHAALLDDLDTPQALALLHQAQSWAAWLYFDRVFGLRLEEKKVRLTKKQKQLIEEREKARARLDFVRADHIRRKLAQEGILIEDTPKGPRVIPNT